MILFISRRCVFIGDNAFAEMNLGSVSFPSTLEYIGNESFKRCGLETVKLPNGLQYIGSWAFADNYSLEEVRFPASVLRVGVMLLMVITQLKMYMPMLSNLWN